MVLGGGGKRLDMEIVLDEDLPGEGTREALYITGAHSQ